MIVVECLCEVAYLGNTKHKSSEIEMSLMSDFLLLWNSSSAFTDAVKCSG